MNRWFTKWLITTMMMASISFFNGYGVGGTREYPELSTATPCPVLREPQYVRPKAQEIVDALHRLPCYEIDDRIIDDYVVLEEQAEADHTLILEYEATLDRLPPYCYPPPVDDQENSTRSIGRR